MIGLILLVLAAAVVPDPREKPTLSVIEAGRLLGLSKNSAYQACATGDIPALRLGGRWVVPTARLLDLLGQSADA